MRFKINRVVFLDGIQIAQTGIGGQKEDLILENILLELNKNKLYLTTTDLEIRIRTEIDIDDGFDGSVSLPAKRLSEIIRQIDHDEIYLDVDEKNKVVISTRDKRSVFSLFGLSASNFPHSPALSKGERLTLETSLLNEIVKKVIFAVAVNDTRHVLCGVRFLSKDGEIEACATNRHRLSVIKRQLKDRLYESEYIIPTKILKKIPHIFKDDKIDLTITKTQIGIQDRRTTAISRLIIGKFPDYDRWLISKESDKKIRLNRKRFLGAVRRAYIMTSERNNIVTIRLERDNLSINVRSPDAGEAIESMDIDYDGKDLKMGLNPRYLIDALTNMDEEEIYLCLSEKDRPVSIKTIDNRQINLIMPIKI